MIDSGMVKERLYDPKKGLNFLDVKMVSKSSAIQRAGRAGRTAPGVCIRLYEEADYLEFSESSLPEIKRMHLGSAVLHLMSLGVPDVTKFDFIEPPHQDTLESSIDTLRMLGALDDDVILTQDGIDMAKIPLEPRGARIVLKARQKGCLDEAVNLTAIMAYGGGTFLRIGTDAEKKTADQKKMRFCNLEGDLLSLLKVYEEWSLQGERPRRNAWCVENCINAKTMRSVQDLAKEIHHALKEMQPKRALHRNADADKTDKRVALTNLLVAAYYDNVGLFTGNSRIGYRSPKYEELFLMHPSSVFNTLGSEPELIVFQDVLKTSSSFVMSITPTDKDSFLSLCPHPNFAVNWDEIKQWKLKTETFQIGPMICYIVIGKRGCKIKQLQLDINENGKIPGAIRVDVAEGTVCVDTLETNIARASSLVGSFIKQEQSKLESQVVYENIGKVFTGYRVMIGKGGKVEATLKPGEFMTVSIDIVNKCHDQEYDQDQLQSEATKVAFSIPENAAKCGHVKEMNCYLQNPDMIAKRDSTVKWGNIRFAQANEAARAMQMISYRSELFEVTVKPFSLSSSDKAVVRNNQSDLKVKVTWSRLAARGFGFIACASDEQAAMVADDLNDLYIDECQVRAKVNNKDQSSVYVNNISRLFTGDEFKNAVQNSLRYEFKDARVVYAKGRTDLEPERAEWEQHIKNVLNMTGTTPFSSVYMHPINKPGTILCNATVSVDSNDAGQRIVQLFNGKTIIGEQD